MSGKLDQSLEEITSATKANARRRNPRRAANNARSAPAGGIRKNVKTGRVTKPTQKAVATQPAPSVNLSNKIIINNLPTNVTQKELQDYLKQIGIAVAKVNMVYGENGKSRGIADVILKGANDTVQQAVQKLDGLRVDNRPLKIDTILSNVKSLAERTTQSASQLKGQPKPAAAKPKTAAGKKAPNKPQGKGKKKGGAHSGRPVKKTAEELDIEMDDYRAGGENPAATAPAANGSGDAAMDDGIM